MNLDRLLTFLEVYRERSMGRAAKALGLTQPGVSAQINALEHELGAPLFERSRKGVVPTAVADGLARDVAGSIDTLGRAMSDRLARTKAIGGVLHLGAPPEMFSHYGPRLIASLASSDIRVHVHLGGRAFLYDGLESGQVDLALTASKPSDRSFGFEVIGRESLCLVGHPYLVKRMAGLAEPWPALRSAPLVAYDADTALLKLWCERSKVAFAPPAPRCLVADLRSVGSVAAELQGWAALPRYIAEPALEDSKLVKLHTSEPANPFHLTWKRSNLRTPRVAFARESFLELNLTL